jgi:hypothetical protein
MTNPEAPRVLRLKKLRNWLFGLGFGALALSIAGAIAGLGGSDIGYKVIAALLSAGLVLIGGGAWLQGLAARGYGEV